jgi:hypothetical protein
MRGRLMRWTVVALAAVGLCASGAAGAATAPDPNLLAAQAAAARILSLTPLPPGATPQSADPSVGGSLSQAFHPPGPQQVIHTRYWTVSGAPGDVSHYILTHPPAGSHFYSEQGPGTPTSSWQETRSFPGQTERVTSELLTISTAPAQGGGTAIRSDAVVLWRPTWEQIPSTARAARVRLDGYVQGTVTGAGLARLRTLVDTQPVVAPGAYACPAGFPGQAIAVTFVDARGRALARIASNSADGCRWLSVRVGARRGPALLGGWDLPTRLWAAGALTRCTAAQLTVSVSKPSVYPAGASAAIRVRNNARAPCSLKGTPSIELMSAAGRRLPVSDRRVGVSSSVVSAPRHGTLVAGVSWPARSRRCTLPLPTSARIGLPGVRPRVEVALTPSRRRLGPCSGRLSISPFGWF